MTFRARHLLGIEDLAPDEIVTLLDLADSYVDVNRQGLSKKDVLRGRTVINLFLEPSTRTQSSFELAGKRLSADVINISLGQYWKKIGVNPGNDPVRRQQMTLKGLLAEAFLLGASG